MSFDLTIVRYLNQFTGTHLWADNIVVFLATYLPWLMITVFLIWIGHSAATHGRRWYVFIQAICAMAVARLGAIEGIRLFYERPRPFLAEQLNPLFVINEWSFPSGHASLLSALAMTVYFYDKTWGIRFFVVTIVVVIARVISGVHYLTDIAAGLVIGTVIAYTVHLIGRKVFGKKRRRRS